MPSNSSAKWFFIKEDPNDRIRATARRHSLGGTKLPSESRLAREVIQNSVDATLPNMKTSVLIWNKVLSGEEVRDFRSLIGFGSTISPFDRLDQLGLSVGNAYKQMMSGGSSPSFSVTIIEDRNTCGLSYDESDGKDRFDELCLSYGQDATTATAERGGSYGFGKGVYEAASNANTFIVYSVYKPSPKASDPGSHARLFACATFDGHTKGHIKYKGRALFGVYRKTHGQQTECRPVLDDIAHETARQLGFIRRAPDEYGTSIMIIGSTIDIEALRTSIEDYWWPRLYSNQLSVELWENNDEVSPPEPKKREDLKPYLRCYSLIEEKITPADGEKLIKLQSQPGSTAKPGQLALKPLAQVDEDPVDDVESDTHLESTVALIRSGPKMVVDYLDPGGRNVAKFAGVFLSHHDVERELHLSEPPAHDSWEPNSPRLVEAFAEDPAKMHAAQSTVESILQKIKTRTREFRRNLVPTHPPQIMTGTRTLQNILAKIMTASNAGGSPPAPPVTASSSLFKLRIREGRSNIDGLSKVTASIDISLSDDVETDSVDLIMTAQPYLMIDDDLKKDTSGVIPLESVLVDGGPAEIKDDCEIPMTAFKSRALNVHIESATFDRDQYAGLDVQVLAIQDVSTEATSGSSER